MSTPTEDDLDTLPEGELLALPGQAIPAGRLTEFFVRRAALVQQRDLDQLMFELSGNSAHHFMTFAEQDPKQRQRREEEQRRRAWLADQAMLEYRQRSDRLLAQIEQQQIVIERRRKEIDDNALRLHDGRRVYVDGDRYRDEQGRVLEGAAADEAAALHREKPDASSWEQKQEIERQAEEARRLKEKVLKDRQEVETGGQGLSVEQRDAQRKEAEQRMTGYEKELKAQVETTRTALAEKPDLAAAYDAVTLDDYAGPAGGEGKTAAPDFSRAVAGLTETGTTEKPLQPSGPGGPKVQT